MPYTPTKFATVTELNNSIINRVYQNTNNAVDGDVHQQVELDEAVSLWREPTAVLPLAYSGLLQSQQIKLTDGTTTGVTLQWNGTAWVEAQARTGKTLWVDSTYGNPANAQPYNPFRPYLNLDAAQTAATTGDTIYVRPGAYTTSGIGKNGVNWYFAPGAVVTGPIRDGGVAMVFTISGFGTFTTAGNAVESTAATGTTINVKANSITSTGGSGVYQSGTNTVSVESLVTGTTGATCVNGTQSIRGMITATTLQGAVCTGGNQIINGNINGFTAGAECSGGVQSVKGDCKSAGDNSVALLCSGGRQVAHGLFNGQSFGLNCTGGTQVAYGDVVGSGGVGSDVSVNCNGGLQVLYGNVHDGTYGVICVSGTQYVHGNIKNDDAGISLGALWCQGGTQVFHGNAYSIGFGAWAQAGSQRVIGNISAITVVVKNTNATQVIDGSATGPTAEFIGGGNTTLNGPLVADVTINSGGTLRIASKCSTTVPVQVINGKLILLAPARMVSASGTYCAVGAGSGTVISFGAYSTLIQDPALVFSGTLNVGAYVQ